MTAPVLKNNFLKNSPKQLNKLLIHNKQVKNNYIAA